MDVSPIIRPATVDLLCRLCGAIPLADIDQLFLSEGIFRNDAYQPPETGERRARVRKYLASLDLAEPKDADKLSHVMEKVLFWPDLLTVPEHMIPLLKLVEHDGYVLSGMRLVRGGLGVADKWTDWSNR